MQSDGTHIKGTYEDITQKSHVVPQFAIDYLWFKGSKSQITSFGTTLALRRVLVYPGASKSHNITGFHGFSMKRKIEHVHAEAPAAKVMNVGGYSSEYGDAVDADSAAQTQTQQQQKTADDGRWTEMQCRACDKMVRVATALAGKSAQCSDCTAAARAAAAPVETGGHPTQDDLAWGVASNFATVCTRCGSEGWWKHPDFCDGCRLLDRNGVDEETQAVLAKATALLAEPTQTTNMIVDGTDAKEDAVTIACEACGAQIPKEPCKHDAAVCKRFCDLCHQARRQKPTPQQNMACGGDRSAAMAAPKPKTDAADPKSNARPKISASEAKRDPAATAAAAAQQGIFLCDQCLTPLPGGRLLSQTTGRPLQLQCSPCTAKKEQPNRATLAKRWDWQHSCWTYSPVPVQPGPGRSYGVPTTARGRRSMCRDCGTISANYGMVGTTARLWCARCGRKHGATLDCK